jgi:2-phospho-L-lactate guanylyltransferase
VHALTAWTAVVPVKPATLGKQRLHPLGDWRAPLAAAFAADVVTALLGSRVVRDVVVVGGQSLPEALVDLPAVHRVADVRGLNPAVAAGLERSARFGGSGTLVLPGDLPCLRPEDVDVLLAGVAPGSVGALADADGRGTAALAVGAGADFAPAFGPGSFARHLAAGARAITGEFERARRDVDTVEHLAAARALGVGSHTAAVLAHLPTIRELFPDHP